MVNRYKHAPNPKMYFCLFNMPHSDFKMKNNNKVVVPLLFFTAYKLCYCVMQTLFITPFSCQPIAVTLTCSLHLLLFLYVF